MKKKILYIITKGNFGGAQRYVYDLASNLSKDQFEIAVALGEGEILEQKLQEKGIRVISLQNSKRDVILTQDFKLFFELLRLLKKEKPHIVHLNSSKVGVLGALAARLSGVKKIIFTAHGFAFNEKRPWLQKLAIKFLSWLTLMLSTESIAVSEKECKQVEKWLFILGKIQLVHNGANKPEFKDRDSARKEIETILKKPDLFSKYKYVVGSIGELTKNKAHCLGLKAFKENPEIAWVIIGEGEERFKLEQIIKEKNISNVFLAGFVPNASYLLPAFDIFLLPSIKEGLPYVILEAGLASLPIIATNVGGIPEIISEENGILIPKENPDAIAGAIQKIISDKNKSQKMAQNLNIFVEKNFSLPKMISETLYIYDQVDSRFKI